MRTEFGDAVSLPGAERDELLDAIFGNGFAWDALPILDAQELVRTILAGGVLSYNAQAD